MHWITPGRASGCSVACESGAADARHLVRRARNFAYQPRYEVTGQPGAQGFNEALRFGLRDIEMRSATYTIQQMQVVRHDSGVHERARQIGQRIGVVVDPAK